MGFGLFGTFPAVGGIAGSYYSSRRPDPGHREFGVWALAFGVVECLAAIAPTAWAYDAAMVVLGAATQLFAVSATVYVQQATPPAQRGHALSAYNAGFIGFVPAGAFRSPPSPRPPGPAGRWPAPAWPSRPARLRCS